MEYWASLQMYRHMYWGERGSKIPLACPRPDTWNLVGFLMDKNVNQDRVCRIVSSNSIMRPNKIFAHLQDGTVWQGLGRTPELLK